MPPRGISFSPPPINPPINPSSLQSTWFIDNQSTYGTIHTIIEITSATNLQFVIAELPLPPGYEADRNEITNQGYTVDSMTPVLSIAFLSIPAGETYVNITLHPAMKGASLQGNILPARIYPMYQPQLEAYAGFASITEINHTTNGQQPGENGSQTSWPPSNTSGTPNTGEGIGSQGGIKGGQGSVVSSRFITYLVVIIVIAGGVAFYWMRRRKR